MGARQPHRRDASNNSIAVDDLFSPGIRLVHRRAGGRCRASGRLQFGRDRRNRHHHLRVRVQGRRRDSWTWPLCRKLGKSRHRSRCSRTVPRARTRARPSRPSTSTRRRRPLYRRLFQGGHSKAACGDPGVPGHTTASTIPPRAFERAGADATEALIVNNLTPAARRRDPRRRWSTEINKQPDRDDLPGGFSGGDEPDGSAKFITAFFRSAGRHRGRA